MQCIAWFPQCALVALILSKMVRLLPIPCPPLHVDSTSSMWKSIPSCMIGQKPSWCVHMPFCTLGQEVGILDVRFQGTGCCWFLLAATRCIMGQGWPASGETNRGRVVHVFMMCILTLDWATESVYFIHQAYLCRNNNDWPAFSSLGGLGQSTKLRFLANFLEDSGKKSVILLLNATALPRVHDFLHWSLQMKRRSWNHWVTQNPLLKAINAFVHLAFCSESDWCRICTRLQFCK